jgi:hypothetical protein
MKALITNLFLTVFAIIGNIEPVVEPIIIAEKIDPNTITVKADVTYKYEAKLPDGSVTEIESKEILTEKQVQQKAKELFQAEIDRQKAIDATIKSMTVKNTFMYEKQWKLYGKVIQYNYRIKLPDGSKQWLNSKVSMKQEECLEKAKMMYRMKMEENV